jgi:hypothetical protein
MLNLTNVGEEEEEISHPDLNPPLLNPTLITKCILFSHKKNYICPAQRADEMVRPETLSLKGTAGRTTEKDPVTAPRALSRCVWMQPFLPKKDLKQCR